MKNPAGSTIAACVLWMIAVSFLVSCSLSSASYPDFWKFGDDNGGGTEQQPPVVSPEYPEANHLKGYWAFETLEDSPEPNQLIDEMGTLHGTADSEAYLGDGPFGRAIFFPSSASSASIPDDAFRIDDSYEYSVSFWFYRLPGETEYWESMVIKDDYGNPFGFQLADGRLSIHIRSGLAGENDERYTTDDRITESEWNHVVLTYKEGEGCLYLNNQLIQRIPIGNAPPRIAPGQLNLGLNFIGAIDEIRVYDIAVSAETVGMLFSNAIASFDPEGVMDIVIPGTYYVDADTGDDRNSGSRVYPWKSIEHAAKMARAGDTVYIHPGRYGRARLTESGTPDYPIIFKGINPLQIDFPDTGLGSSDTVPAVYDGTNARLLNPAEATSVQGFSIFGSHILLENFEVTDIGNGLSAFRLSESGGEIPENVIIRSNFVHQLKCSFGYHGGVVGSGRNIQIRDNVFWRVEGIAVSIGGDGVLVENNDFSHGSNKNWETETIVAGDADAIRFMGSNHTFRKNFIHDYILTDTTPVTNPDGSEAWAHMDAFQNASNTGLTTNILIENNLVINIGGQHVMIADEITAESGQHLSHITFRNNVFWECGAVGLHIFDVANLTIENNIIGRTGHGTVVIRTGEGSLVDPGDPESGVQINGCINTRVTNNLFYDYFWGSDEFGTGSQKGQTMNGSCADGAVWDYNLHNRSFGFPAVVSPWDDHGIFGSDPLMNDPDNLLGADGLPFTADDGYILGAGSPALGAGEGGANIGLAGNRL